MTIEVHYEVAGPIDGEVVVLSGSAGSDVSAWQPQLRPLRMAGFRVVRYDHRGHGRSPIPTGPSSLADLGGDLIALLDKLAVPTAHIVGLSLGGMTAMWTAANHPDRVRSLTLCCTLAQHDGIQAWEQRIKGIHAAGMDVVAAEAMQRWFTPAWRAANPEQVRAFQHMVTATPLDGYVSCCRAIQSIDIIDSLPTISASTLVISAAQDTATPPEAGRQIAAAIPNARFELVEDAAHLGNIEQADRFTDLIRSHLLEVERHSVFPT
ncbi:3-oxoadipate enol-lactonase [Nocardia sp. NPDC049149]|uniref:3-oxoadipate enol-lactonase n=1 Tax=Nocardia sp. NPDC049149 TaxID=3364315 RepID=UPI003724670D